MEQSIYILLFDGDQDVEGDQVSVVTRDEINHLSTHVRESDKLSREAKKLRSKSDKVKRHANKLLHRIITSHGISYDKDQAVGIGKESGKLYVGELKRVVANPEAEPLENDTIVGKITQYERRKYNELVDHYNFLANKVLEHNDLVVQNESELINFENKILEGKKYDKEKQYLVVHSKTGRVLLANYNKQ